MRRTFLVLSAVFAAVTVAAFSAVLAQAQAVDQYDKADGGSESVGRGSPPDPAGKGLVVSRGSRSVSQGSLVGALPAAEARRIEADLAEEEKLPDYSQVVDNTSEGQFFAPDSKVVKDPTAHGGSYVTSGRSATFRVQIPTTNDYAVYAWWPGDGGDAGGADFSIPVASGGSKKAGVDQARDGGFWVKIGSYEMAKGESEITLSGAGDDAVLADAVAVMRGEFAMPPEGSYGSPALSASGASGLSDGRTVTSRSTASERGKVVRSAMRWTGARYRYATCTSARMSCTCLTKRAWNPHGHTMPLTERGQRRYEPSRRVRDKGNLLRGDLVFFKEGGGRRITHVGIYSGNGFIVHASTYFGKVVESKMRYVNGFAGANRMQPRR